MTRTRNIPERPTSPCTAHEMHGHAPASSPNTWVFNIEAVSTLCIAGWYLYGVYISLGLLPHSSFYRWGNTWVIPLLLGIFYMGAGYLYQRYQQIYSLKAWGHYMKREFIVLATPFVAFTLLVLATNSILGTAPDLSLAHLGSALTVNPVVPVGYFEVLFFIYVLTRTPRTSCGMGMLLVAALAAKVVIMVCAHAGVAGSWPYALREVPNNWLWFVGGEALRFYRLDRHWLTNPVVTAGLLAAFACYGTLLFAARIHTQASLCLLTALGLMAAFSLSAMRFEHGRQNRFFGFVTRYTMAIWLMHEILAKLVMAGLGTLGFGNPVVLAVVCVVACYVLPVLVMAALSHVGKLGFIVYPGRYLPQKM